MMSDPTEGARYMITDHITASYSLSSGEHSS